ncbi:MAG: HEAT repeat domain-containing protein, partial [Planctomycetota bacterium]|nr:HEAT repeat domain-containing protein [Planctomycetota bacterium]
MDRDLQERIRGLNAQSQSVEVLQELAILCQRYSLDDSQTPFQGWFDALSVGTKKQQLDALSKIESLGAAGVIALPAMLKSLEAPAKFRRRPILAIIEKLGACAIPNLVDAYRGGVSPATPWIIAALGRIPGNAESFSVLCHAFESIRLDVSLKAVVAFRSCPQFSIEIEARLRPLILRENGDLGFHAIQTLQALNYQSPALFETLTEALTKGQSSQIRRGAACALVQFKTKVSDALPVLIDALEDVKDVSDVVVDNFQFIESLNEAQLARLKALLNSRRIETRLNTVRAVGEIGVAAGPLFPWIIAQFSHEEYCLPQAAVSTLVVIAKNSPKCEAKLLSNLNNRHKQTRRYSAAALGYFNSSSRIIDSLLQLIDDPCPQVRGSVIKSLGQLNAPARLCLNQFMNALLSIEFRESFEAARSIRE